MGEAPARARSRVRSSAAPAVGAAPGLKQTLRILGIGRHKGRHFTVQSAETLESQHGDGISKTGAAGAITARQLLFQSAPQDRAAYSLSFR
jgi:hypothetical protein